MLPDAVSEITHPTDSVVSDPLLKLLIVVSFDRSSSSAQGLPIGEFTRRFTLPTFVDAGNVNG
jgi:hypothetical protein